MKRWLTVFLACILSVSLAACGAKKTDETAQAESAASEAEETPAPETPAPETPAPAEEESIADPFDYGGSWIEQSSEAYVARLVPTGVDESFDVFLESKNETGQQEVYLMLAGYMGDGTLSYRNGTRALRTWDANGG